MRFHRPDQLSAALEDLQAHLHLSQPEKNESLEDVIGTYHHIFLALNTVVSVWGEDKERKVLSFQEAAKGAASTRIRTFQEVVGEVGVTMTRHYERNPNTKEEKPVSISIAVGIPQEKRLLLQINLPEVKTLDFSPRPYDAEDPHQFRAHDLRDPTQMKNYWLNAFDLPEASAGYGKVLNAAIEWVVRAVKKRQEIRASRS